MDTAENWTCVLSIMHQQPEIVSNEMIFPKFKRDTHSKINKQRHDEHNQWKERDIVVALTELFETSKRARSFRPKRCTRHWFCVYTLQLLIIPLFRVRFIEKYTDIKRIHDTCVCQTSYTTKELNRKTIFAICWTPTRHATPTTFNRTRMTNETTLVRKSYQQNNRQ